MSITIDPELIINQIAHRYEMTQTVLGEGGMGMVFQAYDKNLQRPVAIKFIKDMVADETSRMRFQQEVEFLNRGEGHPNIVQVYDYGNVTVGEQEVPYLVMRYMPGSSLADRLYSLAIAHPDIRDQVLRDICEGLTFLHNNGIVHRDLKPANILFDSIPNQQWGRAHISDFGVSWLVSNTSGRIGSGGTGTDWYRAPEQKSGGSQPIDHRADIYAFGLIVWQLFTNRPPPFDLESLPPDTLSEPLQAALRKALATDPADRWGSVNEFFNAVMQSPHPLETPPYQGLDVITNQHTFFGRTSLVNDLVAFLDTHRDLALVGVSGSGKSSLVRAGLMPELWGREIFSSTDTYLLTPKSQPLQSLADALTRSSELSKALATDFSVDPNGFHAWVLQNHEKEILIVVDQLEELFTECKSENERLAFINNLFYAVDREDSRVRIVFTLRADFFSHCLKIDRLKTLLTTSQRLVDAMSPEELQAAIEGPANIKGWSLTFDEGIVDMMVQESSKDAGSLPLLSFALLQTWRRRKGRRLTLPDYEAIGRVEGAIARTADDVLARLDRKQREIAHHILVRLVNLGEGTDDTRRRVYPSELLSLRLETEIVEEVLLALSKERLIIAEQNTVVLAHDAIIREWDQLKQWLAENREWKVTHRYLTNTANAWKDLDKDPGELFRGGRLTHTREQAAIYYTDLNETEREFLAASEASLAAEEAERKAVQEREAAQLRKIAEEESRRRRITARALIGVSILLVIAVLVAIYATNQQQLAENTTVKLAEEVDVRRAAEALAETNAQLAATRAAEAELKTELAMSRQLAAESKNLLLDHAYLPLSILLAIESIKHTPTLESYQALVDSLSLQPRLIMELDQEHAIEELLFVPSEKQLVSISIIDSMYEISSWDTNSWRQTASWSGEGEARAFDSRNNQMAIVKENSVEVRELTTGIQTSRLTFTGSASVVSLAISPDGKRLATSFGTTVKISTIMPSEELLSLEYNEYVNDLFFSLDGRLLLLKSQHLVRVINVSTGLEVTNAPIEALEYSVQGGQRVARIRDMKTLFDFSYQSYHAFLELNISENDNYRVRVLNNFQSADASVEIWDLGSNQISAKLLVDYPVEEILFSPDSQWVGTAIGVDLYSTGYVSSKVDIWDLTSGELLMQLSHDAPVPVVAVSPEGNLLASGDVDGTIKIWDTTTPWTNQLLLLNSTGGGPPGSVGSARAKDVSALAINTNGQFTATGSTLSAPDVRIWSTNSGQLLSQLVFSDEVMLNSVVFQPSGMLIATSERISDHASSNKVEVAIRIWDPTTGTSEVTLPAPVKINVYSTDVDFSTDGSFLIAQYSGLNEQENVTVIQLWDTKIWQQVNWIPSTVTNISTSKNSQFIATQEGDSDLRIWSTQAQSSVFDFTEVSVFEFDSTDKYLALVKSNEEIEVWDLIAKERVFQKLLDEVEGISFSPDGQMLASFAKNSILIWRIDSGEQVVEIVSQDEIETIEFGQDSKWLAVNVSGSSRIDIWEMATGIHISSVSGEESMFSHDGNYIITRSANQIRVWDPANGNEIARLSHEGEILKQLITLDDKYIVASSTDATARIWIWRPDDLILEGCSRLSRNMTVQEWRKYLPEEEYRKTCLNLP